MRIHDNRNSTTILLEQYDFWMPKQISQTEELEGKENSEVSGHVSLYFYFL